MRKKQILLIVGLLTFSLAQAAQAQTRNWISGSADNSAGSRNYKLWVPAGYDKRKPAPLVVMLHGCTQNPEDLAAISGMNAIAEKNSFLVVYPEQITEANPLRCWNWFDPKHQSRGAGEPSLLRSIVERLKGSFNVDARRIYVAGISAGAGMAVLMAAAYPDLFAGIGVVAGPEFKAATGMDSALIAMKQGGPDPRQQGHLAFQAITENLGAEFRARMPVIVFHGTADPYVNVLHADQVIAQWAQTNDYLDDGKDNDSVKELPAMTVQRVVPGGYSYSQSTYSDGLGRLLMEKWIVKDLGHAWSGGPGAGPFSDPKGPNASVEMWRFFNETTVTAARASHPTKPKTAKSRKRAQ